MYFLTPLPLLLPLVLSSSLPLQPSSSEPQHILTNPPSSDSIPTSRESAILARRILHLTPLGTLSTIFPSSSNHGTSQHSEHASSSTPSSLSNTPIGLMDYFADCESTGNPTILAITIATTFRNAAAGSNVSLAINWMPPYPPKSRISITSDLSSWLFGGEKPPDRYHFSAANQPRFSLSGYLETIPEAEVKAQDIGECFVEQHQDAKYWLPGNRIHHSEWMRLVVTNVYWIGGFGDRAYIGWIPVEEWRDVKRAEWEGVRLPGEEKGWREWSLDL